MKIFLLIVFLFSVLIADEVRLVKNINTTTKDAFNVVNNNLNLVEMGNKLYFIADTNGTDTLYSYSDSTQSFTPIKSFNDARGKKLIVFNNRVYFEANEENGNFTLWYSDGTPGGTGHVSVSGFGVDDYIATTNKLYFTLNNNLYVIGNDGTTPTLLKTDIAPQDLYDVGSDTIFFRGIDTTHGTELWISDGTSVGTYIFKDINSGNEGSYPEYFIKMGGYIYFVANDGTHGRELYRTDTGGSSNLVKDINSGTNSSDILYLTLYKNKLYFRALESKQLWISDGSGEQTVHVDNVSGAIRGLIVSNNLLYINTTAGLYKYDGVNPIAQLSNNIIPKSNTYNNHMFNFANTLIFTAGKTQSGYEIYKSDGDTATTVLIKDIDPGTGSSEPRSYTTMNGKLYFIANDKQHGYELWKSDGTTDGTLLVKDLNTQDRGSEPEDFVTVGKTLFFTANDGIHGRELYKSDGTANGTKMVADFAPGSTQGNINNLYGFGNLLFFTSSQSDITRNSSSDYLWRSDGTETGTFLLNGIYLPDSYSSFAHIGNTLYFTGRKSSLTRSGEEGEELFKSDGSVAGTVMVKDIYSGPNSSRPRNITAFGNKILFFAIDDTTANTWQLFVSDGSEAGTKKVKDINTNGNALDSFRYAHYAVLNGYVYFFANDGIHGIELWKSNATEAGTVMVKDINPGSNNSNNGNDGAILYTLGNAVYFIANDGTHGSELYKSNGTEAGTVLVKDIELGEDNGAVIMNQEYNQFTKVNNKLFFLASDGDGSNKHGREIWCSDGTTAGTVMVADLNQSQYSSFVAVGNLLYFSADNANDDPTSLWKTDGTLEGTKIVANNNIYPNPKASGSMCPALFFRGIKYTHTGSTWSNTDEEELWITKGDAKCQKDGFLPAIFYMLF